MNTTNLHFAPTQNGVAADAFRSPTPPTRFVGRGMSGILTESLNQFSATNNPMPFAKVHGNLTYSSQSTEVNGTGYIDEQWGKQSTGTRTMTAGPGQLVIIGNYTIDMFVLTSFSAI